MEKCYGGKSGVWLAKKRKRLSLRTTSHLATVGSSQNPVVANGAIFISKLHRAAIFRIKGSHHGGIIPKKYLLQQPKQLSYRSSHQVRMGERKRGRDDKPQSQSQFSAGDDNYQELSQSYTIASTPTTSSSNHPRHNNHHQSHSHQNDTYAYAPQHSPSPKEVRILGWDSVKCRPIYFKVQNEFENEYESGVNNYENNSFDHSNDDRSSLMLSSSMTRRNNSNNNRNNHQNINEEGYDHNDDSSNHNANDDNGEDSSDYEKEEEEDPNVMWKEILEQMNENARKAKAANKRKAYGGNGGAMKNKNRRGLSHMSLSMLERLVSPRDGNHRYRHGHQYHSKRKQQSFLEKNHDENNVALSDDNITTGRLGKKRNTHDSSNFRSKKQPFQQHISSRKKLKLHKNCLTNNGNSRNRNSSTGSSLPSVPSIPFLVANNDDELSLTTTPISERKSTCLSLESDTSSQPMMAATATDIASSFSFSSSMEKTKQNKNNKKKRIKYNNGPKNKSHRLLKNVQNQKSMLPCALHFPDDLDYGEDDEGYNKKQNRRKMVSNSINSDSSTMATVNKVGKNKSSNQVQRCNQMTKKKNMVYGGKKANVQKDNKTKQSLAQNSKVKQVSSSTSLAAAKAFFDRLDKYELTIISA